MTKLHFNRAAEIVRAILENKWTNEFPEWAEPKGQVYPAELSDCTTYQRAVQTAEAFILMFQQFNSRFDETRFLRACGLVEATKGRKS